MSNLSGYPLLMCTKYEVPNGGMVAHYDASISSSVHITSGVSKWDDLSGNNRHLLQTTTSKQPLYSGSGITSTISFNGSAHYMQTMSFPFTSPATIYMVMKLNSNVTNDILFDGFNSQTFSAQNNGLPNVWFDYLVGNVSGFVSGSYYVFYAKVTNINGGAVTINTNFPQTFAGGSVVGTNFGGFTLAARANGLFACDMSCSEIYLYSVEHDFISVSTPIINFLRSKWSI